MGKTTGIEWASATWNPWMGCTKVSAGCKHCYMFREQKRFGHDPSKIRRSKTTFYDPDKWKEGERIFVCSWSDFFHENVPSDWRKEAYDIMFENMQHTYLILTKRPERIKLDMREEWWESVDNAWLGITAENQQALDERMPYLAEIPASVKFISAEPLLGQLDIHKWEDEINWIIVGGESGKNARIMESTWMMEIYKQASMYDIPYFFKQWGEWIPLSLINTEYLLADLGNQHPTRTIDGQKYVRLGRFETKKGMRISPYVKREFPDHPTLVLKEQKS